MKKKNMEKSEKAECKSELDKIDILVNDKPNLKTVMPKDERNKIPWEAAMPYNVCQTHHLNSISFQC